jgi:glycosyltransferase involved in cell wall biosynthesis
MGISAVFITLNEEKRIAKALGAGSWDDEIVVIDSGSTDHTVDEARRHGAKVFQRKFDDFASQKNFALEKAAQEWVLFLDADEIVTGELHKEAAEAVNTEAFNGYMIPRTNVIFGRAMRYGGHQGDSHLRLFRKGAAHFEGAIHEKVLVKGHVGRLESPIMHYSTETVNEYLAKLELYTDLEAHLLLKSGRKVPVRDMALKPLLKFIKQYFLQGGFLDGVEGFMFYRLSMFYLFVKYAKYFELKKEGRRK